MGSDRGLGPWLRWRNPAVIRRHQISFNILHEDMFIFSRQHLKLSRAIFCLSSFWLLLFLFLLLIMELINTLCHHFVWSMHQILPWVHECICAWTFLTEVEYWNFLLRTLFRWEIVSKASQKERWSLRPASLTPSGYAYPPSSLLIEFRLVVV